MFSNGGRLWLHIHLRDIAEVQREARIVKSKNGSRSASIFLTTAQSRLIPSIPNNALPAKSNFVLSNVRSEGKGNAVEKKQQVA